MSSSVFTNFSFLLGVGVCEQQVVTLSCLAMLSPSMRLCSSGLSSGKMFKRFLEVPESMQSSSELLLAKGELGMLISSSLELRCSRRGLI